jgi:hypothetical protein
MKSFEIFLLVFENWTNFLEFKWVNAMKIAIVSFTWKF